MPPRSRSEAAKFDPNEMANLSESIMMKVVKSILQSVGLFNSAQRFKTKAENLDLPGQYAVASLYCRLSGISRGLPVPPKRQTFLVSRHHNVIRSLRNGRLGAESIVATLAQFGYDIGQFKEMLDFGCGSGRVLRNWKDLTTAKVHGTDYNQDLVNWCKESFSFAEFNKNELTPPTSYKDERFPFIYALSVFTHLDETLQRQWMDEMYRILAPEGLLLISLQGKASSQYLTDEERARYERGELVVKLPEESGSNECAVYHPYNYVRDMLAKRFVLVGHVPEGAKGNPPQDYYLLKKKS